MMPNDLVVSSMVKLIDLKRAIEDLALAQMQLSLAISAFQLTSTEPKSNEDAIKTIDERAADAFKRSSDVFDKLIAIERH